jgi:hypothetical protein
MMGSASRLFLARVPAELARLDYSGNPYELAALLRVRILEGEHPRATAGPPRIMILPPDVDTFTVFHELMHVLMQLWELERAIESEVSESAAHDHLEAVTDHAARLALSLTAAPPCA